MPTAGARETDRRHGTGAVEHRSWSDPQEPSGDEWWADVLADPRACKRGRRTDLAAKQAYYRLADEKREIILVACSSVIGEPRLSATN